MTAEDFSQRLEAVRKSGRGFISRCPAHEDRTPSLSVRDGERGVLVKCWAGCRLQDITAAVGLTVRDLFHDQHQNSRERKDKQRNRQTEQDRREDREYVHGLTVDARREAERLLASARNPGLVGWTDDDLHEAINVVADALEVHFAEKVEYGDYPF